MPDEILDSQDGSHTILSEKFGVSYHSKYGAITESNHVFLEAGLKYLFKQNYKEIKILEMGFGTGLNALLTYQFALSNSLNINYHTFEKYPLESSIYSQLNYLEKLQLYNLEKDFKRMHECNTDEEQIMHSYFTFTKYIEDILSATLPVSVDLIYYDAFAPNSQSELWEEDILSRLYESLNTGGVLTTYCAKGSFKRAMKSVGFTLDSIPGPHGKREMTRGIKMN